MTGRRRTDATRRFAVKARGAGGDGHARRGEPGGIELADAGSHFGTGSDRVCVTDPDTGGRRQATQADFEGMASLEDSIRRRLDAALAEAGGSAR